MTMAAVLSIRDLTDILEALAPVKNKWELIGLQIGVHPNVLDGFKLQYNQNPRDCLLALLKEHLVKLDPEPCWERFVKALRSETVEERALAAKLEYNFCQTPQEPEYASSGVSVQAESAGGVSDDVLSPGFLICTEGSSSMDSSTKRLTLFDLKDIFEALVDIACEWQFLGLQIGVPPHVLDVIRVEYHSPRERLLAILKEYLNSNPEPSWERILEALRSKSVQAWVLAHKLEGRLYRAVSPVVQKTEGETLSIDDLQDVAKILSTISSKWEAVGLQMGMESEVLCRIREKYSDDPDNCLNAMLKEYLEVVSLKPTWETITDALISKSVGEPQLADTVIEKFLQPVSQPTELIVNKSAPVLRGCTIIAEENFCLTRSAEVFNQLSSYGIVISVPDNSISKRLEKVILNVRVSLGGPFDLPPLSKLASPVYWIKPDPVCDFKRPLDITIEHCALMKGDVTFVRTNCTQKRLPYTFERISGTFTKKGCGIISLARFSGIGIIAPSIECCARIFTVRRHVNEWRFFFFVIKNLLAYIQVADSKMSDKFVEPIHPMTSSRPMLVQDAIRLDIPPDGTTIDKKWTIRTFGPPCISKASVEGYDQSRVVPDCELVILWTSAGNPYCTLSHNISVKGTGTTNEEEYVLLLVNHNDDIATWRTTSSGPTPSSTSVYQDESAVLQDCKCQALCESVENITSSNIDHRSLADKLQALNLLGAADYQRVIHPTTTRSEGLRIIMESVKTSQVPGTYDMFVAAINQLDGGMYAWVGKTLYEVHNRVVSKRMMELQRSCEQEHLAKCRVESRMNDLQRRNQALQAPSFLDYCIIL